MASYFDRTKGQVAISSQSLFDLKKTKENFEFVKQVIDNPPSNAHCQRSCKQDISTYLDSVNKIQDDFFP